jgi:hypothetical protein
MTFDWSINIGQIIAIIGMLFALISAYYIIKSDIRALDTKVTDSYHALDLRIIVSEAAVRDQIGMNAKIIAEVSAVRQDVAVIRDRLEPPPISPQQTQSLRTP